MPPQGPEAAPNPKAESSPPGPVVTEHFEVSPARQRSHLPQDTAQGTTTV